jgi:hypothetical protein
MVQQSSDVSSPHFGRDLQYEGKGKGTLHPRTGHEGPEGE